MSIVKLKLPEELPEDRTTELVAALKDAAYASVGAEVEDISLTHSDATADHDQTSDAIRVVLSYLSAMERRDLSTAEQHLGTGFEMHFPNAAPMRHLSDLIEWARNRYEFVRKDNTDIEAYMAGETCVVIIRGTLHGAWPDGRAFAGVRFIDRFDVSEGKITRQDVWNDLGEIRGQHDT